MVKKIVEQLREEAKKYSKQAYAPYSHAYIGSAVETEDGTIFGGCNVENSSYGGTVCAERTAIFKAVSEGHRLIKKIYVYSKDGWPPCGFCRQVLAEFAHKDLTIYIGNSEKTIKECSFAEIFPMAFTPDHLHNHEKKND